MHDGIGRNWLLLRGLSREAAHWGGFIPEMRGTFPDSDVHALDLPGAGGLHLCKSPRDIPSIMEIVRRQARDRGLLQKPLTVLALSMGGMVAWEWLLRYPGELQGAVLVNTSLANLSRFHQRLRWQSYAKVLEVCLRRDVYSRERAILQFVSNRPEEYLRTVRAWFEIQTLRPVSGENALRQIIAAARYKPSEIKPKQPILLINSQGDRLVAPACSVAISDKWLIELYTHPWAGHDLSQDDGPWLAARVKNWIDQLAD